MNSQVLKSTFSQCRGGERGFGFNFLLCGAFMLHFKNLRTSLVCSFLAGMIVTGCGGGGTASTTPNSGGSGGTNTAPNQVALAAVSSQDASSLVVAWPSAVDDATPVSGIRYQVHASTADDFSPSASTLVFEGTGINSATISGLQAGTTYRVRLVAIDESGASTISAPMSGKTADIISQRTTAAVYVNSSATQSVPVVGENNLTFSSGSAPAVKAGDVLVSDAGNGYLRKVTSIESGSGLTVIQTQPAALNEVFSEIELSSSVNLATAVSSSSGLATATAASVSVKNGMTVTQWPEAGLTISGPVVDPGVVSQESVTAPRMRSLAVRESDKATLANGTYGWVNGPQSVAVEAGDSAHISFEVRSRTMNVKVCKIQYLDATPHAGGGDPGNLAALGDVSVKSALSSGESTWTVQNINLTPTKSTVLGSDYYVVRARAYFDDAGDDCNGVFNLFKEKIDFSFNVAVTNPGDALPTTYDSTVEWQGDFKVSNKVRFNFDPVFDSSVKISGASLKSAVTKVKGALGVTQKLTIDASASGALKPQIKVLSPERNFRKVFLVGSVPIVISGSFVLKGKVEGNVTGAMNVTETFDYGFPDFEFGVQYVNGEWVPIKQVNPSYKLVINGTGDAQANLMVSLVPEFKISAYEVAAGRLTVEPKLTANAAIEGHFVFEDADGKLASDADYRFTTLDVLGGVKLYAMADFTIFDKTLAAWPSKAAKPDDYTTWQKYEPIAETKILGLPDISAAVAVDQQLNGDAKTALITVKAKTVPNPLNIIDHAPIILFGNWLTAYPVEPTGGLKIKSIEGGGTSESMKLWVSYTIPGHYKVRIPAQSMLKLRQYIDIEFDIPDANGDGIADPWASFYGIKSASDDPNQDGRSNLVEFQENTNPLATVGVPAILSSADGVTVGQQLLLWINNAYENARAVVWAVGNNATSIAVSISDKFAALFDAVGSTSVLATLQDAAGNALGTVSRIFAVQANNVPRVDAVTPGVVTAGQPQTFTVTGANLTSGLGFNLTDCSDVTEVLIGTTDNQRQFTCTFSLGATPGTKDGAIGMAAGGNPFGDVLKNFSVTLQVPSVQSVAPAEAVRTLATSFEITGRDLPTSGLTVTVQGDNRASCQTPNNMTSTGFGVACQLYTLGARTLEVRQGTVVLGYVTVNIKTNVTGVTWTSPSTTNSGTVKFGETVVYSVAGTNLLADAVMGFAVEKCGVSNTEVGVPSNTLRSFTCNFNNVAGAVAGQMAGVVKDAPAGQVLFDGWKVPVEVAPVSTVATVYPSTATIGTATTFTITGQNLPLTSVLSIADATCQTPTNRTATGFTVVCTPGGAAGSKVVTVRTDTEANGGGVIDASKVVSVSASSSPASKIPHTGITSSQCYTAGSDVLVSCTSAGAIALSGAGKQDGMYADINAMSYSRVGAYPLTSCVKDNVTGLIWEGKEASGIRAGSNTYTNWGDGRAGDASAYVSAVNAQALCGYTDWRLPTVDELQGIVDYGKSYPGPAINADMFVNTINRAYWTASPFLGSNAWYVDFGSGYVYDLIRDSNYAIRLVHAN